MSRNQDINVVLQAECSTTLDFINAKPAICSECERLGYNAVFYEVDFNSMQIPDFEKNTIVLVLSYSHIFLEMAVTELIRQGVHPVILGVDTQIQNCSSIYFDRGKSLCMLADYFSINGRQKTALFGINESSISDLQRRSAFLTYFGKEAMRDIFYTEGSLRVACEKFVESIDKYDSVICSNDMSALMLMRSARINGISVPNDLYVAGCGNTCLGKYTRPSMTTVGLDYSEVGKTAVRLYDFLIGGEAGLCAKISLTGALTIRNSTENRPYIKGEMCKEYKNTSMSYNFINDVDVIMLDKINKMLEKCDATDLKILAEVQRESITENIADTLHIGMSTLRYRLSKIYRLLGINGKANLSDLLSEYNILF